MTEKQRNKGEILPDAETSMIEVNFTSGRDKYGEIPPEQLPIKVSSDPSADKEKPVDILDLCEERGEFPPKVRNRVQNQMFNPSKQYIAGSVEEHVNQSSSGRSQLDDKDNRNMWLYSPMDFVSKWSKALKKGVTNSMGLGKDTHSKHHCRGE